MTYDDLQLAVDDAQTGHELRINNDLSVTNDVDVTESVTIDGNGFTVTGNFAKNGDNSNNAVLTVLADNTSIRNLTVDGVNPAVNELHGINIYEAAGVNLLNISSKNARTGLVVGKGASVDVKNINTSNVTWHGINVDKPGSILTIGGINTHNHAALVPHIWVDDREVGKVFDQGQLYNKTAVGNGDAYFLDLGPDPNNNNALNLSGTLYRDIALDNCKNLGECKNQRTSDMLADWTMNLYKEVQGIWTLHRTAQTNNNGVYNFGAQQEAGVYHVCVVMKPGWTQPIQTWTGSGYRVATANPSHEQKGEGPYCATTTYDDLSDHSSKSNIGVVDTGKPTGSIFAPDGFANGSVIIPSETKDLEGSGVATAQLVMQDFSNNPVGNWQYNVNTGATRVISGGGTISFSGDRESGQMAVEFDTTQFTDGTYSLRLFLQDRAGNGNSAIYGTLKIDNTAPTSPLITKPTPRQWFKATPIQTLWDAATDEGSDVDYYQVAYRYDDGHTFGASTCAGEQINGQMLSGCRDVDGTSRNHVPSASEQGGVTVWVRAVDNAGNIGPWSNSVHYYYDNTAPEGDITSPVAASIVQTADGKLKVAGTVTDNLSMNRVGVQLVKPGVSGQIQYLYDHMVNQNPGTWEVEFDAAALGLENGLYGINLAFTDMAGNTSTKQIQFTLDNPAPSVVGENFNTHSGADYEGINVGFRIAGFSDVTGVSVSLFDGEDMMASNTHNQSLLNLINDDEVAVLSTPFVIIPGSYVETYWNLGDYDWASDSPTPTKAVVEVTGKNAIGQETTKSTELVLLSEPNGWAFASILPAAPIAVVDSPSPTGADDEETNVQSANTGTQPIQPAGPAPISVSSLLGAQNLGIFNSGLAVARVQTANDQNNVDEENTEDVEVLGEEDEAADGTVTGATESDTEADEGCASYFGLCWYWWVAIGAAGVATVWLLVALRQEDDR